MKNIFIVMQSQYDMNDDGDELTLETSDPIAVFAKKSEALQYMAAYSSSESDCLIDGDSELECYKMKIGVDYLNSGKMVKEVVA